MLESTCTNLHDVFDVGRPARHLVRVLRDALLAVQRTVVLVVPATTTLEHHTVYIRPRNRSLRAPKSD